MNEEKAKKDRIIIKEYLKKSIECDLHALASEDHIYRLPSFETTVGRIKEAIDNLDEHLEGGHKIKNEAQIHIRIITPSRRGVKGLGFTVFEEIEEELRELFKEWRLDGVDILDEFTGNVVTINQICPYCSEEFPRTQNIHDHMKRCEG